MKCPNDCEGWNIGCEQIDALLISCANRGLKYTGPIFKFCPWCGERLVTAAVLAAAEEFVSQIIIEPDGDGFHAYRPALKGLHTYGETEQEALENAKRAVIAYLRSLVKYGDPIPLE